MATPCPHCLWRLVCEFLFNGSREQKAGAGKPGPPGARPIVHPARVPPTWWPLYELPELAIVVLNSQRAAGGKLTNQVDGCSIRYKTTGIMQE